MAATATDARSRKGGRPVGVDGKHELTRGQAARLMGIGTRQIRWLEETGQLTPRIGPRGVRIFRRVDIEEHLNSQPGMLASRAFSCFERGLTPQQTVIELHAIPSAIAALHTEWIKMSGAWVVAGPRGSRQQWEQTYGVGPLTPIKLRTAFELIGSNPDLRAELHKADAA